MNPFVAWAVSWQGTAALMCCALVCGMILGWLAATRPKRITRKERRELADRAAARADAQAVRWLARISEVKHLPPPEVHHQDPRVAHEAWLAHSEQALALVRDDLTDSAYTADMAARMDRFLEGLCGVPYSADELWSGQ